MPWTPDKPEPLDDYVERLRGFRASFDRNENFIYGAFSPDEQRVLGGTGLHERVGERALEIGYWIRTDAVGQGLATELSAVLTRVAFERCGVDRVEIRVEPANAASARVPRKLGYLEEATLRRRLPARSGEPLLDVVIFSMLVEELAASPCAAASYRAFDAAGREQRAAAAVYGPPRT